MKKIVLFVVCLTVICIFASACHVKPKANMVQAKRRLEQYLPTSEQSSDTKQQNGVVKIDLSEGPKLQYNRNLGPQDVNFDFKVNVRY